MARATPRPVEALPCGSASSSSTRSPTAESAVPRLIAVVVLPTPPFWLAMAKTRQPLSGTGETPQPEDAPRRVAAARDDVARETPGRARLGDLGLRALSLQEKPDRAPLHMGLREPQQLHQRRHRPRRHHVRLQRQRLGAGVVDLRRQTELAHDRLQKPAFLGLAF